MRFLAFFILGSTSFGVAAKAVPLKSSAHFGMSLEDRSSIGFKQSVGSTMFFDVTRPVNYQVEVGLRSIGSDGIGSDSRFYRLGVGPLVSAEVLPKWHIQLAPFFFQESGEMLEGDESYRSKGYGILIGWERSFELSQRVSLCWGGYITRHWGSLWQKQEAVSAQTAQAHWVGVTRNDGGSRGVELALRMSL